MVHCVIHSVLHRTKDRKQLEKMSEKKVSFETVTMNSERWS